MLVIGAGGFAKEVLDLLLENGEKEIVFFDDINVNGDDYLYENFQILKNENQVSNYFQSAGPEYILGIGNPHLRIRLDKKFEKLGGILTSIISPQALIGKFDVSFGNGCAILPNSIISNSVSIGKGCIVYYNVIVTHDCTVGDFVELSPGATILGSCKIGSRSKIGSNATILPNLVVGENVTVGAGAVVTTNLPNGCTAVGVPARIVSSIN